MGCARCKLDQRRSTRGNLRFYACCSLRSFVSLGGQWNFRWRLAISCARVAVAVRLTRAVRLARISLSTLGLFRSESDGFFSRRCLELPSWLLQRYRLRSLCACHQSRATRSNIALACFSYFHSFHSFGGTRNFRFGCCSGLGCGRCALDQSRATRANISFYACSVSTTNSSVAVGQSELWWWLAKRWELRSLCA